MSLGEFILTRWLTHWQVSDMNFKPLCDHFMSSFGEVTQPDTVIHFPSETCALSQRTVPTRVPALACVANAWGRQPQGSWGCLQLHWSHSLSNPHLRKASLQRYCQDCLKPPKPWKIESFIDLIVINGHASLFLPLVLPQGHKISPRAEWMCFCHSRCFLLTPEFVLC